MLILTRKKGESIKIGDDIEIFVGKGRQGTSGDIGSRRHED